jgi:hypothetical protein
MGRSVHLCGRDVGRPGHICAFFTSRDEEYETLLPYIKEGVEEGEEVLNVLDATRLRDHRARLLTANIPVDDGVTLATSEDTYLADGRFDMDRMVAFVRDRLEIASARGHCVRTAGWMDWLVREAPGSERAIEYEARMNLLVPTFDCTFMCVYDLSRLSGSMVADIIATHPYVILRGRIRENPFFIPPEVYLRELLVDRSRRESATNGRAQIV